jgi:chaperonin GroEL (HSP60 family)
MLLKRGIDAGTQAVVAEIKKLSIPVGGQRGIEHIAAIAANDAEIGQLLAQAMEKVGRDGVITIEEGKSLKIEVEYTEGMQFDRGYISPYFVSDLQRMEASVDDPYILITDKKISGTTDLVPVLEKLVQTGHKDLLVIAEDVDAEALALVVNKLRGILNVVAVKRQDFGDRRRRCCGTSPLTGGTVISDGWQEARRPPLTTWQSAAHRRDQDDTTIVDGAVRRHQGPYQPDQGRDRKDRLRLRPRKASGEAGEALRWRGGDQGRGSHRGRAKGEKGACRGCPARDPSGHRRGCCRRRRHSLAACSLDCRWATPGG